MGKKEFRFLEAYRVVAPTATREVAEARQKAHAEIYSLIKTTEKVYDLCRIAFNLSFDKDAVAEWFEKAVKGSDIHFSLELDKAEGARLATLLLRDLVSRSGISPSLACVVASYCGKREPAGGGSLISEAGQAISTSASQRRIALAEKKIEMPPAKDLKKELDVAESEFQGPNVRAALAAVSADARDGIIKTANAANDAVASLRGDAKLLAEEVDMLWWYVGDWSELLKRPRTTLTEPALALASAFELGDLVQSIPGPYGVYGLLRRALSAAADSTTSLKTAIERMDAEDLSCLIRPLPAGARILFPVQAAINLAGERGTTNWTEPLEGMLGAIPTLEVTYYDLAVQAFRERLLIGLGGLGQ